MQVFDNLEDLISHNKEFSFMDASLIYANIEEVFSDKPISGIQLIDDKYSNPIFTFWIDHKRYVYRYPSDKMLGFVDRQAEQKAMEIAKDLDLDSSIIWMNEFGHKISYYIVNYRFFDYEVKKDVELALAMMHTIHDSHNLTGIEYDIMGEIDKYWLADKDYATSMFTNIFSIRKAVKNIYQGLDYQATKKVLCHNDIYPRNILITYDKSYLIDWEFAKDGHPAFDLACFFIASTYSDYEINRILKMYLNHDFTDQVIKEYYSYFVVVAFYWLLWALHLDKHGQDMEVEIKQYHKHLMKFIKQVKTLN